MREILFRGVHKHILVAEPVKGLNWVYGYLAGKTYISNSDGDHYVDYDSIGQYTGREDKHGIKIFEGDFVRVTAERTHVGVVHFKDCSFFIDCGYLTMFRWVDYELEVLGNEIEDVLSEDDRV